MTRLLLRWLNAPALMLLTALGVALQTSLFTTWPLVYFQPDIVLLVVLWCAFRRDFTEGGIITLMIAAIAEAHSATPQGVFLINYMFVYLMVRTACRILVIPDLASFVVVTLFASVLWKISNLTVLYLLGANPAFWRNTLFLLFPGAIVQGAAGFWIYRWLEKFDRVTHKNARTEQAMEDELLFDEGL